uniref:Uncharacterized protein n=1 Tax=Rhizophora mucronata TaxID=61149 RepID=A0A2P2MJJ4_RHIMU
MKTTKSNGHQFSKKIVNWISSCIFNQSHTYVNKILDHIC